MDPVRRGVHGPGVGVVGSPYPVRVVNIVWRYCYLAGLANEYKTFVSSFKESLPSSFLATTFGQCLFTPKTFLQRKICVFSMKCFSLVLKSSFS